MKGVKGLLYFTFLLFLLFWRPDTAAGDTFYFYKDARGVLHFSNVGFSSKSRLKHEGYQRSQKGTVFDPSSLIERYDPIIRRASVENNIDPALLKAIIHTESGGRPQATSPKGAMGLMQLMPVTASSLSLKNPYDPLENIRGGANYLRKMLDRFNGDLILALAAYNAGPGAVERIKSVPNYPETRRYIKKVLTLWRKYRSNR